MTELARAKGTIDAPAEDIWAILLDFGHPQRLAKTIESCEVTGEGVGAVRVVKARGRAIHERLAEADCARFRFVYEAISSGDMPAAALKSYRATVVLKPLGSHRTEIEWLGEGDIEGPPEALMAQFAQLYSGAIENLRLATRQP